MSGWEGAARVLKEQEESSAGREREALRRGSLKDFGSDITAPQILKNSVPHCTIFKLTLEILYYEI